MVLGRENIPTDRPFILAVNHLSTADIGIVFVGFPNQPWRYFAGEMGPPLAVGPLMSWLGVIFVNRGEVDRQALREALARWSRAASSPWLPKARAAGIGAPCSRPDGAAYLASQSGAPILPVGLSNTDVLFAGVRRLRRVTVTMRIGPSFTLPDLGHRPRSRDLADYTCLITTHIAALVEPRHRGVHGDTPARLRYWLGRDPWPACVGAGEGYAKMPTMP